MQVHSYQGGSVWSRLPGVSRQPREIPCSCLPKDRPPRSAPRFSALGRFLQMCQCGQEGCAPCLLGQAVTDTALSDYMAKT